MVNSKTDEEYLLYESRMKEIVIEIFEDILKQSDFKLNISVKARGGAEISEILQQKFKTYLDNYPNKFVELSNHKVAPSKSTKSPFDVAWDFEYNGIKDYIWGDIKTFRTGAEDSNPDMGTPNKLIKFMNEDHFYLCFILFKYSPTSEGLVFDLLDNKKHVDFFFLKDSPDDLRINPKPQFQMNISGKPKYRTRSEFLVWFYQLWNESIDRIEGAIPKKRKSIRNSFINLEKKFNFKIPD